MFKTFVMSVLVIGLLSISALAVFAQDGDGYFPPYIVPGENGVGVLDTSQLTPGEQVIMPPPDGFPSFTDPITGACVGCLVYNSYTAANGHTILVPDGYSALMMAMYDYTPFDTPVDYAAGNAVILAAAQAGVFEDMGIDPATFDFSNLANRAVLQDALAQWLRSDPLAIIRLNAAMMFGDLGEGQWFFAMGFFDYSCHPVTGVCAMTPADLPNPNDIYEAICRALGDCPTPPTDTCPRDWEIIAADPLYTLTKLDPPNPLVVGQDPEKYGVSIQAEIEILPVIVRWNAVVQYPGERVCRWHEGTSYGGCSASYDRLDSPTGAWYADGHWGIDTENYEACERQERRFDDNLLDFNISANLSADSIAWITTGDLQNRYPGAHVYQAEWPLYPGYPAATSNIGPTHIVMSWEHIPFADPGEYVALITGQTQGTPYTNPRELNLQDEPWFNVALLESALIK